MTELGPEGSDVLPGLTSYGDERMTTTMIMGCDLLVLVVLDFVRGSCLAYINCMARQVQFVVSLFV